jgi:hypothetical protein
MMEEFTMHAFRRLIPALLVALVLFVPFSMAQADVEKGGEVEVPAPRTEPPPPPPEEPVAAVPPPFLELTSTSVAVGIGISWGEGTLSFEGTSHPFSVRGLSLLDIGASVTEGLGEVYNLENLADFEGTYVAVEAAGAAGIGNSATVMRNQNGVARDSGLPDPLQVMPQARPGDDPAGPRPFAMARLCRLALVLLSLGAACATGPPARPSYHFFATPDPAADPWYAKVEDWQARSQQEALGGVDAQQLSGFARHLGRLERKIGSFVAEERIPLAKQIATWAREEGRRHYRFEEDPSLEGDHWPTYGELVDRNGDDCDGLDLIAYHLLIEFGFPRDELFRAVMRRNRDRKNHMVTMWFQDPGDPRVFDATGAMTMELARFSETAGWTPTAIFNEREQFSVVESGFEKAARVNR